MVVELDQPGAERPVRLLGVPIKLSRTPGRPGARAGPGLGEHTRDVLAEAGYPPEEIDALHESGAVAGPAAETVHGLVHGVSAVAGDTVGQERVGGLH